MSTLKVNSIIPESGDVVTVNGVNIPDDLSRKKSLIINGNLSVNQRGVNVSSISTGEYGEDRWKKTDGGMTQIVESKNYEFGETYTLSYDGGNESVLTAPSSGHWTLPDIPITARKIKLELGVTATDLEYRSYGEELALCQRYYQFGNDLKNAGYGAAGVVDTGAFATVLFHTEMRSSPTMTSSNERLAGAGYTTRFGSARATGFCFSYVFGGAGEQSGPGCLQFEVNWTAEAEL
jgi:hypothetical protein